MKVTRSYEVVTSSSNVDRRGTLILTHKVEIEGRVLEVSTRIAPEAIRGLVPMDHVEHGLRKGVIRAIEKELYGD